MSKSPVTLQLRYLQTPREIAVGRKWTTIFPIPIDLVEPLLSLRLLRRVSSMQRAS